MNLRLAPNRPPHKLGPWPMTLALALGVGACGQVGDLRPPPGQPLPIKPVMAQTVPTPEELLTPPPIARPVRVDEVLRRSEPRRPDRFDLPPPSGPDAAPEPEGDSSAIPNDNQTRVQEPQ